MSLMQFLDKPIEDYLHALSEERGPTLKTMEKKAEEADFPIVGPLIGQYLRQMAAITQAKKVFEMGSGFGYSAYWFLKGMPANGKVHLTDDDPKNIKQAKAYLEQGGYSSQAEFHTGNALDELDKVTGPFDIIFIDIEKKLYPKAFVKAISRLRKGGLLIADNVLWSGTVLVPDNDQDNLGIKEFNRLTHTWPQLVTTIVPIRDGLSISVKL